MSTEAPQSQKFNVRFETQMRVGNLVTMLVDASRVAPTLAVTANRDPSNSNPDRPVIHTIIAYTGRFNGSKVIGQEYFGIRYNSPIYTDFNKWPDRTSNNYEVTTISALTPEMVDRVVKELGGISEPIK